MKRREIKFTHFLMVFSLTVVTVLLMVIGTILYFKTKHILEEKITLIHSMKMNQAAADVRKQFEDIYESFDGFRNYEFFIDTVRKLMDDQTSAYDKLNHSTDLEKSISNLKLGNDFIDHVMVMTSKQQFSSNKIYSEYFLDGNRLNLTMNGDKIVFVSPGQTYEFFQLDRNSFSDRLLREVIDQLDKSIYFVCRLDDQAGNQIGLMILQLNTEALKTQIPYADSLAILGVNGRILYQGLEIEPEIPERLWSVYDKNKEGYKLLGKRYEIRDIGFNGLHMVFVEPEVGFHREQVRIIAAYSLLALLGSALLSYVFSRLIGKKILFPLHSLIRWTRRFERLGDRWDAEPDEAKNKRLTSMRERFFVYFLLTILLPTFVFVVLFYVQSTKVVSKEVQQTYYALFEKSAHRVELFVKQKSTAMSWLAYDPWVTALTDEPGEVAKERMDHLLFTRTFTSLSQDAISIYDRSNRLLYTNRYKYAQKMDTVLYESMKAQRKSIFYWLPPVETGSSTVSLSMSIVNIQRSYQSLGFLKTDINGVYFSSLYSELNGNGREAFIVDDSGRILSHPEVEKVGQMAKLPADPGKLNGYLTDQRSALYFSRPISGLPWYLVTIFDASTVREQAVDLIYDDIYLFIIIFLLILVFSYIMSQHLVRPLSSLHLRFLRMDLNPVGRFARDEKYAIDEVEQLRSSFNRLLEQIERLVDDKLKANNDRLHLEFEKKATQIEALQAQINPHLLHNTLENVMYMIEEGEQARAVDMIGLLSRLFRYAMGKDSPLTTVREEIAYSKTYIKIMGFRYKDRIHCDWFIDDSLLDKIVVKMIVQPIIENAIRHTMHTVSDSVRITVSISRIMEDLVITVADNGPGLSESQLTEIRGNLERRNHRKVGLYNVNSRIKLHFGDDYGIHLDNHPVRGAIFTMKIPLLKGTDL